MCNKSVITRVSLAIFIDKERLKQLKKRTFNYRLKLRSSFFFVPNSNWKQRHCLYRALNDGSYIAAKQAGVGTLRLL